MPTLPEKTNVATDPSIKDQTHDSDDWSGLTDPAERRRRQNRINQRARRKRQRLEASINKTKDTQPKTLTVHCPTATALVHNFSAPNSLSYEDTKVACMTPDSRRLLVQFAQEAYRSYMLGSPTSEHLLTLTRVNVFRAYIDNMKIIGGFREDGLCDDAISKFCDTESPGNTSLEEEFNKLPLSLRPTKVQRTIPHHPWLDFFPHPRMRDNLINAESTWDDEELCVDLMAFWGGQPDATAGLLVWGEPWDYRNWEMTEPFLKKYQWTVRGCTEMMTATNAWRAKRGEKLLFRYMY